MTLGVKSHLRASYRREDSASLPRWWCVCASICHYNQCEKFRMIMAEGNAVLLGVIFAVLKPFKGFKYLFAVL